MERARLVGGFRSAGAFHDREGGSQERRYGRNDYRPKCNRHTPVIMNAFPK